MHTFPVRQLVVTFLGKQGAGFREGYSLRTFFFGVSLIFVAFFHPPFSFPLVLVVFFPATKLCAVRQIIKSDDSCFSTFVTYTGTQTHTHRERENKDTCSRLEKSEITFPRSPMNDKKYSTLPTVVCCGRIFVLSRPWHFDLNFSFTNFIGLEVFRSGSPAAASPG